MILLVDVGNSYLKWATWNSGKLGKVCRCPHRKNQRETVDPWGWSKLQPPKKLVICNVAGEVLAQALTKDAKNYWGITPDWFRSAPIGHGVRNGYSQPLTLGADRWAALVAAASTPHPSLLIADCGTALTLDGLSRDNVHLGGWIVPGLTGMRAALLGNTAGIATSAGPAEAVLAQDTGSGVASGTLQALAAVVDRAAQCLAGQLGEAVSVLLTGGDGKLLLPHLNTPTHFDEDLVLRGLAVAACQPE
mgnify:CR=1 FL=1